MEDSLDDWAKKLQESILEDIRNTYSEVVIDHWMNPRNFKSMEHPDGYAKITGPCGDTMEFFLRVSGEGVIEEANFLTDGCGSSISSGSVCVAAVNGKSLHEAMNINQEMLLEIMGGLPEEDQHCPLLAANTLHKAVDNYLEMQRDPWKKTYKVDT
jgi:nitrogen fixation NifU-like protein